MSTVTCECTLFFSNVTFLLCFLCYTSLWVLYIILSQLQQILLSSHVFFKYSHKILPSIAFIPYFHSSHGLAPCVAEQKRIPDSVFSTAPTFPPLTFCTFTATLHLLSFPPANMSIGDDPTPLTSLKSNSPALHTSCGHPLWLIYSSLPQHLGFSPPPLAECSHLKDVTLHPCSPLGETLPIINIGEWFAWQELEHFTEGGMDGQSVCVRELAKVLVWIIHSSFVGWINQEIGKQKNTSVLCYISRVYSLKFTFKGQIAWYS